MTARFRLLAGCAFAACIAGCAAPGTPPVPAAVVMSQRTRVIPAERATDGIAVGKSTRADVLAALGETLAISFESGFEIWVYRLASDTPVKPGTAQGVARNAEKGPVSRAAGEFVVLFAPSGVVAKTRIRPAPQRAER